MKGLDGSNPPLSAIESLSVYNSARDDRNTRPRGRISHTWWQRRTLRSLESAPTVRMPRIDVTRKIHATGARSLLISVKALLKAAG